LQHQFAWRAIRYTSAAEVFSISERSAWSSFMDTATSTQAQATRAMMMTMMMIMQYNSEYQHSIPTQCIVLILDRSCY